MLLIKISTKYQFESDDISNRERGYHWGIAINRTRIITALSNSNIISVGVALAPSFIKNIPVFVQAGRAR